MGGEHGPPPFFGFRLTLLVGLGVPLGLGDARVVGVYVARFGEGRFDKNGDLHSLFGGHDRHHVSQVKSGFPLIFKLHPTWTSGKPLCDDSFVSSQHKLKPLNFRPEPDERADGKAVLDERGWEMDGFLRACLRLLREEPDRLLEMLAPHRPPPKLRGRPKKRED